MAEGVFSTSEKISDFGNYSRTRDSIPDVGKQVRTTSPCWKTVSDAGEQFPKTVRDVGKWFPVLGNGFRCQEAVLIPELLPDVGKPISDIGKWFMLFGNILIGSAQSK